MQAKLCYYNEHWNIYLYSKTQEDSSQWKEWIKTEKQITKPTDGGEFRLRTYSHPEIPIHTFGIFYNDSKKRPGHDGEWSSRAEVINEEFGVDLLDISVDQIAVAVPVEWIKKLLGDNVTWQEADTYGHIITHVKGEENIYHKWVEIKSLNI